MTMIYTSLLEAHKAMGSIFPDYRKMARGWSNIAEDGSVVLSLWAHQFMAYGANLMYTNFEKDQPQFLRSEDCQWQKTPQNYKRMKHLRYALDHNHGLVKCVVVTPFRVASLADLKNQNKTYEPRHDMLLGIGDVDWNTGEFTALVLALHADLTNSKWIERRLEILKAA
jgi:hypothetical protein